MEAVAAAGGAVGLACLLAILRCILRRIQETDRCCKFTCALTNGRCECSCGEDDDQKAPAVAAAVVSPVPVRHQKPTRGSTSVLDLNSAIQRQIARALMRSASGLPGTISELKVGHSNSSSGGTTSGGEGGGGGSASSIEQRDDDRSTVRTAPRRLDPILLEQMLRDQVNDRVHTPERPVMGQDSSTERDTIPLSVLTAAIVERQRADAMKLRRRQDKRLLHDKAGK
jgi:hypothetical protein